jgi:outer membrane protein assembly factor BamD (BamD/ComL family)
MTRPGLALILLGVLLAPACRSVSRDFNNALPAIFRAEPGAEEMERLAVLKRGRVEVTPEQQAERVARVEEAKLAYAEGRYDDAASLFEDFLDDFPGTEFDEECRFLRAESEYRDDEFAAAYGAFKSYTTNFPVSSRGPIVEERLYDIGRDYLEGNQSAFFGIFSNRSKGVEILDYLAANYPNSERADDAKWLIARYHLEDEDWDKAAITFDYLVEQYKASEWFPAARYFSAYCRYRRVKGDIYDPRIIEESRRRFVDYLKENPNGEWRRDAETIVAELDGVAAERELNVGLWYLDQDKPYSARYYFLRVSQKLPESDAARRAAIEYAEVAAAVPDTPEEELLLQEEQARRAARDALLSSTRPPIAPPADAAATRPADAPESAPASRSGG